MSKPFMQLYVADYLGDTRHLTTEQHGAYLLLLMSMWRGDGSIPNDEEKIARLAGLSLTRWRKISTEVMDLMIVAGGLVTQKRLKEEFEKASEKSRKRSSAGHAGGVAKALKDKKPRVANASRLPRHLPEPEPEPEPEKNQTVPTPKAPAKSKRLRLPVPETDFPTPDAKTAAVIYWQNQGRPDLCRSVEDQVEQFLDHHKAHGKIMANWPAAWRTWVRNAPGMTRPPRHTLTPVPSTAAKLEPDTATWVRRLEYFDRGNEDEGVDRGYWSIQWGPKPSQPGCKVPPEAFAAYTAKWPPKAATGGS